MLLDEASHHRSSRERIGAEASERAGILYTIYRIFIHPKSRPTACMTAGMNGNGIAALLSILRLVSVVIHDLPTDYRYVIYPKVAVFGSEYAGSGRS